MEKYQFIADYYMIGTDVVHVVCLPNKKLKFSSICPSNNDFFSV